MAKDPGRPTPWVGTRDAGLERLRAFQPRMGRRYAQRRNYDHGGGAHEHVSTLSPYLRRRLVLEEEAVSTALSAHGMAGAEKFIQEVIWRGYFKGWLERRPSTWQSYRHGLEQDLIALEQDRALARAIARAESGETGIACFDTWVEELVETGYLHNHARMWFASIWIFTLGLPWRIGADFFYRHLLDGDPASNTLSWRWVGGLHTRGKIYEAQAWNIAKFTGGRFHPRDTDLQAAPEGLEGTEPDGLPPLQPIRAPQSPVPDVPTALLITEEDCRIESFDLDALDIRAVATLSASHLRSPRLVADLAKKFEAEALADAAVRLGRDAEILRAGIPGDLARWAERAGARQVVTAYVPEGPLGDWMQEATPALEVAGITLTEWRRAWDSAIWPHASAGFFKVKQKIPRILGDLGLV